MADEPSGTHRAGKGGRHTGSPAQRDDTNERKTSGRKDSYQKPNPHLAAHAHTLHLPSPRGSPTHRNVTKIVTMVVTTVWYSNALLLLLLYRSNSNARSHDRYNLTALQLRTIDDSLIIELTRGRTARLSMSAHALTELNQTPYVACRLAASYTLRDERAHTF